MKGYVPQQLNTDRRFSVQINANSSERNEDNMYLKIKKNMILKLKEKIVKIILTQDVENLGSLGDTIE